MKPTTLVFIGVTVGAVILGIIGAEGGENGTIASLIAAIGLVVNAWTAKHFADEAQKNREEVERLKFQLGWREQSSRV